ncbi:MAG: hypothetical protein IJS12_03370 [Lachnospiraceae bacterium]|nr:hypothetical protein [Lachnospiraceae bacterium]
MNGNGELVEVTAGVVEDEQVLLHHEDAVQEKHDWYAEGDENGLSAQYNEASNNLNQIVDGDDDNTKFVPDFNDHRADTDSKSEPPKSTATEKYEATGDPTVSYRRGATLVINKDGNGTETVDDHTV